MQLQSKEPSRRAFAFTGKSFKDFMVFLSSEVANFQLLGIYEVVTAVHALAAVHCQHQQQGQCSNDITYKAPVGRRKGKVMQKGL